MRPSSRTFSWAILPRRASAKGKKETPRRALVSKRSLPAARGEAAGNLSMLKLQESSMRNPENQRALSAFSVSRRVTQRSRSPAFPDGALFVHCRPLADAVGLGPHLRQVAFQPFQADHSRP